jgi:mevalonate kinase
MNPKKRTTKRRSINAQNVAREVLETIRNGKMVNLGDIIEKNGYSEATSTVPSMVTDTKSYKEVMEPVVKQMEKERQRILDALSIKDLDTERHKDLVGSMDTLTKNIQLLGGKETERSGVIINVVNYGGNSPV